MENAQSTLNLAHPKPHLTNQHRPYTSHRPSLHTPRANIDTPSNHPRSRQSPRHCYRVPRPAAARLYNAEFRNGAVSPRALPAVTQNFRKGPAYRAPAEKPPLVNARQKSRREKGSPGREKKAAASLFLPDRDNNGGREGAGPGRKRKDGRPFLFTLRSSQLCGSD